MKVDASTQSWPQTMWATQRSHTASLHARADVVEALLSSLQFTRPGLANNQGQNALHISAMKGHTAVVRTLDFPCLPRLGSERKEHQQWCNGPPCGSSLSTFVSGALAPAVPALPQN